MRTQDPLWIRTAMKLKRPNITWQALADEVYETIGEKHHPEKIRGALRRRVGQESDPISVLEQEILQLLQKGPQDLHRLSDKLDCGITKIAQSIENLKCRYDIDDFDSEYRLMKESIPEDKRHKLEVKDGYFRFALISDTHLCSKMQQLTYLNDFYDRVVNFGANIVFHAGDILEGEGMYKGQAYEVFLVGADNQIDYTIKHYPRRDGVITQFVTGNHDLCYYKKQGQDVGRMIANEREDLVYLGQIGTYIDIVPNISLYLLHPDGGGAYAISYKPQKIAAGFQGGEKPRIMSLGHWHQGLTMFERNIHIVLPMCFQGQTQFLKRKGLEPKIGGYLCEALIEDNSIREFTTTAVTYYRPIKDDYKWGD